MKLTAANRKYRAAIKDAKKAKGVGKSKYGNVKTLTADGIKHASGKQARRWAELQGRAKHGFVKNLRREVEYKFVVNGFHVCSYFADHVYDVLDLTKNWLPIVEDVKSVITRKDKVYAIKKKLMKAVWNIEILEV